MNTHCVPSVPLITHDPYFSLWSPCDHLYDGATCHWTGREQALVGVATIDGTPYRFMGAGETRTMTQTALDITPTASVYTFEAGGAELTLRFTSPLLLTDLERLATPCTFLDFSVKATDGAAHAVTITVALDEAFCHAAPEHERMAGGVHVLSNGRTAWMGRRQQPLLCHSGDNVTIDWGYLYLACPRDERGEVRYEETAERTRLCGEWTFDKADEPQTAFFVVGYDDVAAIQYFGAAQKAYWARGGKTILKALSESLAQHRTLLGRCDVFDEKLMRDAWRVGGADYARLCALAYRQSIAAHKLIADPTTGEVVFLSKECFSNGCIGTVDVSYPSVPLYLLYNPELVKGMMRPVLAFARMPVWPYDFAPHDVGRYPYATGQVYGAMHHGCGEGDVFPPYYLYPAGEDVYDLHCQMPVEECGNMLIMAAAVTIADGSAEFAAAYGDLWEKWVSYLLAFGADPGEQLCTDDFAGHLAHNVNLAAKAILGVEAYAVILRYEGRTEEAAAYHERARAMATDWERRADRGDHTALTFDGEDGWSLKYNLVWDRLFDSGLFSPELYRKEIAWYLAHQNAYGVPLDSRRDYTKSDWILWCAALTDELPERQALIAPIARFLEETADRVPFSDWYETMTGEHHSFQNRTVQGGLFMPLLAERLRTM